MNFGFRFGYGGSGIDPNAYRIVEVNTDTSGSCEFTSGNTCTATSTLSVSTANAAGAETFTWSVDAGTIASGQGTSTITIETTSNVDIDIIVTCEANDTVSTVARNKSIVQVHDQEIISNGVTYLGEQVEYLGVPITYNPGVVLNQVVHNGIPLMHNGSPIIHT